MEIKNTMTMLEHIAELRKRILQVAAVFILSMVIGLIAAPYVLSVLKHHSPAFQVTWNVFSPWDGLRIYMSIGIVLSLLPTLPFALYQIWLFVNQGLNNREQKAALRFIPFSAVCFIIGVSFAYFVVFPMSLAFTTGINSQMELVETYGVSQYFGFMFNIMIPLSLAFELPVVVLFLTRIGLLSPAILHTMRRYAYVILVIIAALISPPDLVSHLMVAIPLIGLYEISTWLASRMHHKQKHAEIDETEIDAANQLI
ncbi:Sec-independent protein translocase, TatC subunit [Paenibacillus vortex V453]|uniref:Sec-independent protein translocase protein TatC n=1 Tax=Paenibacillus vortex V453 TaxID=715225 RepID=A0A2R9SZI5_9BACL|nr:twin-arginine translocase subunit TatC [Paenibacillus vortex]EFU42726.1 Sec-independent protein translocase, TatC subunit [Paenibacillus vortex V453]